MPTLSSRASPCRYVAASCQAGIIRLWSLEDVYKGATTAASEAGAASASAQDSEAQSTVTAEAWDTGLEVTQGRLQAWETAPHGGGSRPGRGPAC